MVDNQVLSSSGANSADNGATQRVPLRRQPEFLKFWVSESAAQVAIQLSALLLPFIAATTLDATPFQVGLLAALEWLPFLVIGLVAGAWVDRMRRRPLMIVANIGRGVLMAAVPLLVLTRHLTIESLYVIAVLAGICTVFFNLAYVAFFPVLIAREDLVAGNSMLQGSASAAQIAGPGVGGLLAQLLTAPFAVLVNGLLFLAAGLLMTRVQTEEPPPTPRAAEGSLWREVREGVGLTLRHPVLRTLVLSGATVSFFGSGMFMSIYVLFMTRDLGLDAGAIGLIFSLGGVGALVGSLIADPLKRRFGQGRTIIWSMFVFGVTGLFVPLAVVFPKIAVWMIIGSEFFQWLAIVVYDINALSMRQAMTPLRLAGRVTGAQQFFSNGVRPIGALLGGVLGGMIGLAGTLVLGELGMMIAFIWLLFSPIRRIHNAEPIADQEPEGVLVPMFAEASNAAP